MYNRILKPLLDDNPHKTISSVGIHIRKVLYPIFKVVIPWTVKRKMLVTSRGEYSRDKPLIFVSTHEFREDAEAAYLAADMPTYIVNGSISIVMNSFEGITNWLVGMILVDRSDKNSRRAVKNKMIYALKKGASIIIYPEGTWNKSPNQIISGLFPGVYEVAKTTGAKVVAIAHLREGDVVYSKVGNEFDISQIGKQDAMEQVKENMATLRYELMEKYGKARREDFPYGQKLTEFWEEWINGLMDEVPMYDYELEKHTKWIDKGVTLPVDAFDFFKKLIPSKTNAFLYRDNEKWWCED